MPHRELLLLAPEDEVRVRAEGVVRDALLELAPEEVICRVLTSGSGLYVMCHLRFKKEHELCIADLDSVREKALEALESAFKEAELDIVVTGDPELGVLHEVPAHREVAK